MTYRERREAKADRLREWAAKREERAAAVFEANKPFTTDYAFNTQPGHIPLRARIIAQEDRAHESLQKAHSMESRADGIERQLRESIYNDDPDAIEALEARLVKLEAEREGIKAHNKAKRNACTHPANCDCRSPFPRGCSCKDHPLPAYHLQNLSGNIKRNRDRLEALKRQQSRQESASECSDGLAVKDEGSGYVSVTFSEKPDAHVRQTMKDCGFWFRQGSWWGKREDLPAGIMLMA